MDVRVEVFTVLRIIIEATISLGAGVLAGSVLLVAFGLDGVIEGGKFRDPAVATLARGAR